MKSEGLLDNFARLLAVSGHMLTAKVKLAVVKLSATVVSYVEAAYDLQSASDPYMNSLLGKLLVAVIPVLYLWLTCWGNLLVTS